MTRKFFGWNSAPRRSTTCLTSLCRNCFSICDFVVQVVAWPVADQSGSRGLGRLGLLAVGLGIGAAVASTPGVASADSSTDWLSSIDQLLVGLSVPAADPAQALDMQVSIGGLDLFTYVNNSAIALTGPGDIAIAIGNGSYADAGEVGSTGDFAFADGTNDDVVYQADGGIFDFASAVGNDDYAVAGHNGILDLCFFRRQRQRGPRRFPSCYFDVVTWTGDMLSAFASDGASWSSTRRRVSAVPGGCKPGPGR